MVVKLEALELSKHDSTVVRALLLSLPGWEEVPVARKQAQHDAHRPGSVARVRGPLLPHAQARVGATLVERLGGALSNLVLLATNAEAERVCSQPPSHAMPVQ
jgi:hypothetical protein